MKILSIDPGVQNYAFSLITNEPNIIFSGHLQSPIKSITQENFKSNICLYKKDIRILLKKANLNKDDIVVIERYQSRGHRTLQIELINIMLGIIIDKLIVESYKKQQVYLITPATWKLFIKNKYGTNNMAKIINKKELSIHIKDTIGLATYIFEKKYNIEILNKLKENL